MSSTRRRSLETVKRVFSDPYDVEAAAHALYVVDTGASGSVYRIAPDGKATVLSRG